MVTTTPSSTELVAAAGGLDRIVGVDRFSTYPPEVKGLPVIGDFMSPSVDGILQLKPDLVVLDAAQGKTAEALEEGGVRTLVLEMHTTGHVIDGLALVGRSLGTSSDVDLVRGRLTAAIAAARAAGASREKRPRVLLVVDREIGALRSMVSAGRGTYLDELVAMVGGENVMAASAAQYPKVSPETVLEIRPEVILDATFADDPAAAARDWSSLGDVPAVASGRVHMIGESFYVSPSPRLDIALDRLRALLFP